MRFINEKGSKNKKILILDISDFHRILQGTSGAPRLVKEELRYFKELGHHVTILSLPDVSLGFKVAKLIIGREPSTSRNSRKPQKKPFGFLIAPFVLAIVELILRTIDIKYKRFLKKIKQEGFDIIVYNRPIGVKYLKEQTCLPIAVVEHNVEYIFFAHDKFKQIGIENEFIPKVATRLFKCIERWNIQNADCVLVFNDIDAQNIAEIVSNKSKITIWSPLRKIFKRPLLAQQLSNKDRIIIGFVGSNARHNIDAVNRIIQLAKKLPQSKFEFWIIGSVGKAFENYTEEIPSNVRFLGFVDNLHTTLEGCDIFINPKFISPTGIEVKMFDYLKANKPIISTRLGAKGFEELIGKKIFIADSIEEMAKVLLSIIEEGS